ncbi:TniB family NTP-binding protein [Arthrobacter liuii]|uniref:ATP-binding protein n=1 Tax=Arthrobacter liuii TaxID=1476996 RepID=UPI001668693C|nr:ATP-binding protein [Arthrobacter liuii]
MVTHWSGYLQFLLQRGEKFRLVPMAELLNMTPSERTAYDLARLDFLSDRVTVENETVVNIRTTLETVMHLNHGKPRGGYGVFVSAPSGRGKTTAVHLVLGEVLAAYRDVNPSSLDNIRSCPVAYICVPDSGTPKSIYMEIADYLGIAYKPHDSDPILRTVVLAGIAGSGIEVFAIDEVQNLENGGSYSRRAADAIRRLADDTTATFLLAGINLEVTNLTRGARGMQISNRFIRADVAEYSPESENWMSRWQGLVTEMANALPLYATRPETLKPFAGPLHSMTGGSVQALNLMLTQVARELIEMADPRRETVTLEHLRAARVNMATEAHIRAQLGRTKTKADKSASTRAYRTKKPGPRADEN